MNNNTNSWYVLPSVGNGSILEVLFVRSIICLPALITGSHVDDAIGDGVRNVSAADSYKTKDRGQAKAMEYHAVMIVEVLKYEI